MELPSRIKGDILLPPGEMTEIRRRLKVLATKNDLSTVIACAFDHRTRILPFIYADMRMVPAGVRAIGSAMVDSGFEKTRIVLQQWNKRFNPEEMRIEGKLPDLFMVSSMHLHSAACDALIRAANRIDPAKRPLIIVGGPRFIYEPWQAFSADPEQPSSADVAVTGEEYVLLSLLEVLLSLRAQNESMRSVFIRARDSGALDCIPGLVYSRSQKPEGPIEELVDTGMQRLLGNLDELPHPVIGYSLLEAPSRDTKLAPKALAKDRVKRHCMVSSIVLTVGCKFRCAYCPIPAYNQRQHRVKSGERIADEMGRINEVYRINTFGGADDNFFNDTAKTLDIAETLARKVSSRKRPHCNIRYFTEVTVHDTVRMKEHLPLLRRSGLMGVWMGVEDLTGTLVKKGQSEVKTLEAFQLLRQNGIHPIPMMMHHDTQPLVTFKNNYGIVNQLRTLRKAGAIYTQVLMLSPAPGSKWYEDTFSTGLAFKSVGETNVEQWISDGNYVIASKHPHPWMKQLSILMAYFYFFNPLRLLIALIWSKSQIAFADEETRPVEEVAGHSRFKKIKRWISLKARAHMMDAAFQLFGMLGLIQTVRRTLPWTWQLIRGKIERFDRPPASRIPMRSPIGQVAVHALPGTELAGSLTILQMPSEHACESKAA